MGGVLVGDAAYRAYANMLGVTPRQGPAIQGVEMAEEVRIEVVIAADADASMHKLPAREALGVFSVPSLDRKTSATSYAIGTKAVTVELMTSCHGEPETSPVRVPQFDTWAAPMRFADYLLEDSQTAALLQGHGIVVNVPTPARFALHRLLALGDRSGALDRCGSGGLEQAEALLDVLAEERPGDLLLAADAAARAGGELLLQLRSGLQRLRPELAKHVRAAL